MADEVINVTDDSMELAEDAESCHVHKIDGKSIDDYTKVSWIDAASHTHCLEFNEIAHLSGNA